MVSPLVPFMAQVASLWEELDPPDLGQLGYRHIDERQEPDEGDLTADRCFWFEVPVRLGVEGESDTVAAVRWEVIAQLVLSDAGRSAIELAGAIAEEGNRLLRSIEVTTAWPDGVIEVLTDSYDWDRDDDGGPVLVSLPIEVVTEEAVP